MEGDNEPKLEAALDDAQPAAPIGETPDAKAIRRALARLLRKRVKKFVGLAPQVRPDADPKIVHDVRVGSRRLQQAISAFFPKPRSGKVRRLRRTPRRIRRALGKWRNYDVLLEIIAKRQRHTRSEAKRQAWAFVRDSLLPKRDKEVARGLAKLRRENLRDYAAQAARLLDQAPEESPELLQRLGASVSGVWTQWLAALARAQETGAVGDLHGFRIASKELRYRIELLDDVGHGQMKPQLQWLAAVQDALGVWHDRQVLSQAVAKAVARAEILLNETATARILLAELERDRQHGSSEVEKIFRLAIDHPARKTMESWSAGFLVGQVTNKESAVNNAAKNIEVDHEQQRDEKSNQEGAQIYQTLPSDQ
jgi:CHAD domain-containing protein